MNQDLELLAVDVENAFDTVNHDIMLNKLYHDGITGDMWLLLRNIYDGLILKVKWGDQTHVLYFLVTDVNTFLCH